MYPEGVLDDFLAVLAGQVFRHSRFEIVAGAGILCPCSHHHHLVRCLDFRCHVGETERHRLVFADLLAERAAYLRVLHAEFEGPQSETAGSRGDIHTADLDSVHHLVEAVARLATENRRRGEAQAVH